MDKLGFLEGEAEEPIADAEPAAADEAPVEAQPEAEPEPQPVVTEITQPEQPMVPLAALLEVRDDLKTVKTKLAAYEQPKPEAQPVPDQYEDPEGFQAWRDSQVAGQIYQTNLYWSRRNAERDHGKELVDKVMDWGVERCAQDPMFNAKIASSPDPVGAAIEEYRRSNIDTSEYEQFMAWKQAQAAVTQQPALGAPPARPVTTAPPVSIASATSAGGVQHVATGSGVAFDEVFKR